LFRRLAGSIAANPIVYDLIQKSVGADVVNTRTARALALDRGWLVDVGAGTGLSPSLQPVGSRYLAIDVDARKLERLRAKQPAVSAVFGDGAAIPVGDASADALLVKAVLHHLDDGQLDSFVAEAARVLKPGASLVLSEPLWARGHWLGRLLWAGDRGSYPRSEAQLRGALEPRFQIRRWETFAILHRYLLAVAVPATQG